LSIVTTKKQNIGVRRYANGFPTTDNICHPRIIATGATPSENMRTKPKDRPYAVNETSNLLDNAKILTNIIHNSDQPHAADEMDMIEYHLILTELAARGYSYKFKTVIEIIPPKEGLQICNECGRSVAGGSGDYVNRVPDGNSIQERIEMGKPYPRGDFMCAECDHKANEPLKR